MEKKKESYAEKMKTRVLSSMATKLSGGSNVIARRKIRKHKPIIIFLLILLLCFSIFINVFFILRNYNNKKIKNSVPIKTVQLKDAIEKIDDHKIEDINIKMKSYIYAIYNPNKLPSNLRSNTIRINGRQVITEVVKNWEKLDTDTQKTIRTYIGPISKIKKQLK